MALNKLVCEISGCYSEIGTRDYVRTENEAKNWPDKNMPIALCNQHSVGRTPIKRTKIVNGRIMVETELRLPPHIKIIQGAYFNTSTNRWIGEYKIKQICEQYWDIHDPSATEIKQPNGIIAYKKTEPVIIPEALIPAKEQKAMSIGDYYRYRGFSSAHFYTLKRDGFVKFTNEKQLFVDVEETDKLLESRSKKVKTGGRKRIFNPSKEHLIAIDERIAKENKEIDSQLLKSDKLVDISNCDEDQKSTLAWFENEIHHLNCTVEDLEANIDSIEDEIKSKQSQLDRLKELPVYSVYERIDIDETDYFNSACTFFMIEEHQSLEALITKTLRGYGVDWKEMKLNHPIIKANNDKQDFWYGEYEAMICSILHKHLPINRRLEWLSSFMNRSINDIGHLLGIHYQLYYGLNEKRYEYYLDFYCDIEGDLSSYFTRYYRFDHSFKFKEDDKS